MPVTFILKLPDCILPVKCLLSSSFSSKSSSSSPKGLYKVSATLNNMQIFFIEKVKERERKKDEREKKRKIGGTERNI